MLLDFRSPIHDDFHVPLKRKVKTMESLKCGIAIGVETLYGMASLFCLLITVKQHRQVEHQTVFEYELCALLASIIGEYGCLRTGTRPTLVFQLKVDHPQPDSPDIVIVDGEQLLYQNCFRSRQLHKGQTRSVPTDRNVGHFRSL